jgi:hypothetical protein
MPGRQLARIRRGDDRAHGFLIEALEATLALQVLQVAADRAVAEKGLCLGAE